MGSRRTPSDAHAQGGFSSTLRSARESTTSPQGRGRKQRGRATRGRDGSKTAAGSGFTAHRESLQRGTCLPPCRCFFTSLPLLCAVKIGAYAEPDSGLRCDGSPSSAQENLWCEGGPHLGGRC